MSHIAHDPHGISIPGRAGCNLAVCPKTSGIASRRALNVWSSGLVLSGSSHVGWLEGWKGAGPECASPLASRHHSPLHSPTLPHPHTLPSDLPVSSSLFHRVSASNSSSALHEPVIATTAACCPTRHSGPSHTHTRSCVRSLAPAVPLFLLPLGNGCVRRSTAASPYSIVHAFAFAFAFRMTVLQKKRLLAST